MQTLRMAACMGTWQLASARHFKYSSMHLFWLHAKNMAGNIISFGRKLNIETQIKET